MNNIEVKKMANSVMIQLTGATGDTVVVLNLSPDGRPVITVIREKATKVAYYDNVK